MRSNLHLAAAALCALVVSVGAGSSARAEGAKPDAKAPDAKQPDAKAPAKEAKSEAGKVRRDFGSWRVICSKGEPCQAFLTLKSNVPPYHVLTFSFYYGDDKRDKLTSLLKLPLGVAVQPGVRFGFSDKDQVNISVEVCHPDGCAALSLFDAPTIAKLAGLTKGSVYFFTYAKGIQIALPVPLDGLSDALAFIKTYSPAGH